MHCDRDMWAKQPLPTPSYFWSCLSRQQIAKEDSLLSVFRSHPWVFPHSPQTLVLCCLAMLLSHPVSSVLSHGMMTCGWLLSLDLRGEGASETPAVTWCMERVVSLPKCLFLKLPEPLVKGTGQNQHGCSVQDLKGSLYMRPWLSLLSMFLFGLTGVINRFS